MDKKFYEYHLKNTGLTKLLKIKMNCEISIFSNRTEYNTKLIVKSNGYYIYGDIMEQIELYKDSSNDIYYLCTNGHDQSAYLNIGVNIANDGYAITDYADDFDTTGLTKLNPLNINEAITNRKLQYSPTITANTVTEYVSYTPFRQYMAQQFLLMFSGRLNNGTAANALLLFHRITSDSANNSPEFTIETIYADANLSQFNITPTKKGFTFTNASQNYRYSITEISNNTNVNSL